MDFRYVEIRYPLRKVSVNGKRRLSIKSHVLSLTFNVLGSIFNVMADNSLSEQNLRFILQSKNCSKDFSQSVLHRLINVKAFISSRYIVKFELWKVLEKIYYGK